MVVHTLGVINPVGIAAAAVRTVSRVAWLQFLARR